MVRTQRFHCRGPGSIIGQGTKIPQATWHRQNKNKNKNNLSSAAPPTPRVVNSRLVVPLPHSHSVAIIVKVDPSQGQSPNL